MKQKQESSLAKPLQQQQQQQQQKGYKGIPNNVVYHGKRKLVHVLYTVYLVLKWLSFSLTWSGTEDNVEILRHRRLQALSKPRHSAYYENNFLYLPEGGKATRISVPIRLVVWVL